MVDSSCYAFAPCAQRALRLDQKMRESLRESLLYLAGEMEGRLSYDEPAFSAFLDRLSQGPVAPLVFALYGDLVLAVEGGRFEYAQDTMGRMISHSSCSKDLHFSDLGDTAQDPDARAYVHCLDNDPTFPLQLAKPSAEDSERMRAAIRQTLSLLDSVDPAAAAEIRVLVREIIFCSDTHETGRFTFEGASSLFLWGGILLNVRRESRPLAIAQTLAHESAHNLLFGLSPDEPLLLNGHEEKYGSPLRPDLRPLEGIYHATYVLARVHRMLGKLASSGALNFEDGKSARAEMQRTHDLFKDGLRTLELHAELTSTGIEILKSAQEHMKGASPVGGPQTNHVVVQPPSTTRA